MRKRRKPEELNEEDEWLFLTPQERFEESLKLWELYISLGGDLDTEPDSQSPFDFSKSRRKMSSNRRAGLHIIRRS